MGVNVGRNVSLKLTGKMSIKFKKYPQVGVCGKPVLKNNYCTFWKRGAIPAFFKNQYSYYVNDYLLLLGGICLSKFNSDRGEAALVPRVTLRETTECNEWPYYFILFRSYTWR